MFSGMGTRAGEGVAMKLSELIVHIYLKSKAQSCTLGMFGGIVAV